MAGMKVNFNNVRKQAIYAYEKLVRKLNSENEYGTITIEASLIQEDLDDLRSLIGTIAMCSDGSEDVKDVYSELYPEGKSMIDFNV